MQYSAFGCGASVQRVQRAGWAGNDGIKQRKRWCWSGKYLPPLTWGIIIIWSSCCCKCHIVAPSPGRSAHVTHCLCNRYGQLLLKMDLLSSFNSARSFSFASLKAIHPPLPVREYVVHFILFSDPSHWHLQRQDIAVSVASASVARITAHCLQFLIPESNYCWVN